MNIYELATNVHEETGDFRQAVDAVIRCTALTVLEEYAPDDELEEWVDTALNDVRGVDFDGDEEDEVPA